MRDEGKVVGYIVANGSGPMGITVYDGTDKVLCEGGNVHLFATRRAAKAAMKRSMNYAVKNNFTSYWDTKYRICLVKA